MAVGVLATVKLFEGYVGPPDVNTTLPPLNDYPFGPAGPCVFDDGTILIATIFRYAEVNLAGMRFWHLDRQLNVLSTIDSEIGDSEVTADHGTNPVVVSCATGAKTARVIVNNLTDGDTLWKVGVYSVDCSGPVTITNVAYGVTPIQWRYNSAVTYYEPHSDRVVFGGDRTGGVFAVAADAANAWTAAVNTQVIGLYPNPADPDKCAAVAADYTLFRLAGVGTSSLTVESEHPVEITDPTPEGRTWFFSAGNPYAGSVPVPFGDGSSGQGGPDIWYLDPATGGVAAHFPDVQPVNYGDVYPGRAGNIPIHGADGNDRAIEAAGGVGFRLQVVVHEKSGPRVFTVPLPGTDDTLDSFWTSLGSGSGNVSGNAASGVCCLAGTYVHEPVEDTYALFAVSFSVGAGGAGGGDGGGGDGGPSAGNVGPGPMYVKTDDGWKQWAYFT